MLYVPRPFFALTALLFVSVVQAEPKAISEAPSYASEFRQPDLRGGSRYGIGYESRQGVGTGAPEDRSNRTGRPAYRERTERPTRGGRGGRDH